MQSRRAIERAEVVVLVLDAVEGATDQDAAIAGAADKAGRGLIVAANKWDLVKEGGQEAARKFDDELARQMKFLDYAPVLHISARTGERVPRLLEVIDRVSEGRRRRVPSAELNRFVRDITAANPPASPGRREVRVMYATQVGIAPPTFVFFTNVATTFHFSYRAVSRQPPAGGVQLPGLAHSHRSAGAERAPVMARVARSWYTAKRLRG